MRASIFNELMALNLSAEQLTGVMTIMARELAPLDKIRESAAQRQARKRDSTVMASRDNTVTDNVTITGLARGVDINNLTPNQGNNINLPLSPSKPKPAKPKADEPEGFAEFLAAYPRRDGGVDWKSAAKAFNAALRRTDFQTLMASVRSYAAEMQRKGKVGTEFVRQPRTWLNADPWKEQQETATPAPSVPVKIVLEGTPEWESLKSKNPRLTARDIRTDGGVVRGTYDYGSRAA